MKNEFRKVLVIAYYFPPMGLSGVQRTAKFVKYLPQYGWKPTVLTVTPTGYYAMDDSLLKEVEQAGTEILRANSLDPNRLFRKQGVVKMPSELVRKVLQFAGDTMFFPDTKIGWKRSAVKAASELMKREQFNLIFATAPPQTDFLIGETLKKRFGLPLVLDYRDAWLDYPFKYYPTPLHTYIHYRMEKRVLKASDRIIVTLRRVKESILKHYLGLDYKDVVIIPQGYDPEDFKSLTQSKSSPRKKMCITHAGTFYAGRNPSVMLQALHNVFHEFPNLRGRIELKLIGNVRGEDQSFVNKLRLQQDVTFLGYLEHRDCTKQLVESDILWIALDNNFQSPGKLYEYIGARRPILGSIVDGYMKQLILESKSGVCIPPTDVKAHETAIVELFSQYEKNQLKQMSSDFAQKYNRLMLTGELAKQFESLMDIDKNAFVKTEVQTA
ncbi:MAG: glycosyltransferase family 4 protein [Ignavibacteriales bacterium]|nr:glycosyltransferase family 4 protein [Ignavibacteriales bacterium]